MDKPKIYCSNCGVEIEDLNYYNYGWVKGNPYYYKLCDTCGKNLSEKEHTKLAEIHCIKKVKKANAK